MKTLNFKDLIFFCFVIYLLFSANGLVGQSPVFHNYSQDNILMLNDVYNTFVDRDGYVWIAGSSGMSRFDGYELKRFKTKGSDNHAAFFNYAQASDGTVYSHGLRGQLRYIEGDSIQVGRYESDTVVLKAKRPYFCTGIYIDSTDAKYMSVRGNGFFKFHKGGGYDLLQGNFNNGVLIIDKEGKMPKVVYGKEGAIENITKKDSLCVIEFLTPEGIKTVSGFIFKENNLKSENRFWKRKNRDIIAARHGFVYLIRDFKIIESKELGHRINGIWEDEKERFYFASHTPGGLLVYKNVDAIFKNEYEHFLKDIALTSVERDKTGGYWIGSLSNGLYYVPGFDIRIFEADSDYYETYPIGIIAKNENELFFGTRNGKVYHFDIQANEFTLLPIIPKSNVLYELHYDKKTETLWIANENLWFFKNDQWTKVDLKLKTGEVRNTGVKRLNINESNRTIWFYGHAGFGGVYMDSKETCFNSWDHDLKARATTINQAKDGTIWGCSNYEIFQFKDDSLTIVPEVKTFMGSSNALCSFISSSGKVYISIIAKGILEIDQQGNMRKFSTDDGLVYDGIHKIYETSPNVLWFVSDQGICYANFNEKEPKFVQFKKENGLPSPSVRNMAFMENGIWMTSRAGLMFWDFSFDKSIPPAPLLQRIEVNGKSKTVSSNYSLKHDQTTLKVDFRSLQYEYFGKVPYRYRITENSDWIKTQTPTALLTGLASGDYNFEVQTLGQSGSWSDSTSFSFSIAVPWWRAWWFWTIITAVLIGSVILFYRNQNQQLEKQANLQKEINDLERAALSAQMNPHFIFNCLNSIQNFIIKNDREQAVNYLSKFAKLIRRVLKSSAEGKIILEEEIDFLKNYLSLEQLRFKDKFDFKIDIDPKLDLVDVEIPALLIQPFVENAIKHGMKDKKSGGKINLSFVDKNEFVKISVTDNGSGIYQNESKPKLHQSMGLGITSRRLEIINAENPIQITEVKNDDDKIIGTEINLSIKKLI